MRGKTIQLSAVRQRLWLLMFFNETAQDRMEDKVDKTHSCNSPPAITALITAEAAGLTGTTDI